MDVFDGIEGDVDGPLLDGDLSLNDMGILDMTPSNTSMVPKIGMS